MGNRTVVNLVEVAPSGVLSVRFAKQVVADGVVVSQTWHRTSFPPGVSVDEQMRFVNDHLVAMGCARVSDYTEISGVASGAHTPECVAAYRKRIEEEGSFVR